MNNSNSVKCINEITKSPEDKRCYRGLIFGNEMKVLLISDSNTDKAAACLNVSIGHFSDPEDIPGLAHFCEHMLFLGTTKYPEENDYTKYISEHGGQYNASTSPDYTTYFFDVLPEHFEGALDRFAQFFLGPLFTESATEREINAVNSEFEKNVPLDGWRLLQLDKHVSKASHPYHKFGIGSLKTLSIVPKEKGINIREELLKFHHKWYSSNIMTLVILGKESLDELEKLGKSLFLSVPNHNVEQPEWKEHPYGPEHLQIKSYVVPIKDTRTIHICFPAPDFHEHYKSGPFRYISHLIGHEGPGSLLSALKARGFCNHLESGYQRSAKGFAFFNVKADLTEDGMKNADEIVTLVFQYINLLKKEGPKQWIFNECQQLQQTAFRFKEKEKPFGYVTSLAKCLHDYPIDEVLCGPYFLEEWRPDLINEALTYLQPKFVRVAVVGQAFENVAKETEPWFGTKYKIEKIPPSTIEKWENCGFCSDLKLPDPNEFITDNYSILPCDGKSTTSHPSILLNNQIIRVWYKQDDEFKLPKATLKFEFSTPLAYLDPLNCSLTHMFVQVLKDSLNEYAYDAELAGLAWYIMNTEYGITLSISGYNDKQGVLLDKILERMTNLKVDPKRFEFLKEIYVRNLKNFDAEQPYHQVMYYVSLLVTEHAWTKTEMLNSVEYLTRERLENFIPQLLAKMHIECLIHGNVDPNGASKIIEIVENRLTSNSDLLPVLPKQMLRVREIQLLDGSHFMYEMVNSFFSSSCTETYYQCDPLSTKNNMLMELLVQIMQDPCFNILRTKEQLGYIVSSGVRRSNCVQGLRIIVQSDRHPAYIEQRIEAFLIQFREIVENMSEQEFERHRESLATVRLEKPKKMSILSSRFWDEITSQQYHFNRAEVEVAYLRTITKADLMAFFDDHIKHGAPHRRKISVHILAKGDGGAGNQPEPEAEFLSSSIDGLPLPPPYVKPTKVEDVTKFKSSHGLYPLAQPYMNIASLTKKSKL
ncbi:hypothetical protein RUM43_007073 [Polyplax serrata]|uniref:Insulin-degrading enzyme n=1 Tax=Polyplax serrata TaxID=468196 RepID=A0AAN8P591_POLSC